MNNPKLITSKERLDDIGVGFRKLGRKIVFTAGGFDLIHIGHARYLSKARSLGDVLVAGIACNQSMKEMKGPRRPILDEKIRAEMLSYLVAVNFVYIHPEKFASEAIRILKPNILVMSEGDWTGNFEDNPDVKAARVVSAEIVVLPRQTPFLSTSAIIEKIASQEIQNLFKKQFGEEKITLFQESLGG